MILVLIIWLYFLPTFICYKSMFRYYSYGEEGYVMNKHIMDYIGPAIPILNIYMVFVLIFLNRPKRPKKMKTAYDDSDWEELLAEMIKNEDAKKIEKEESVGIKFKF